MNPTDVPGGHGAITTLFYAILAVTLLGCTALSFLGLGEIEPGRRRRYFGLTLGSSIGNLAVVLALLRLSETQVPEGILPTAMIGAAMGFALLAAGGLLTTLRTSKKQTTTKQFKDDETARVAELLDEAHRTIQRGKTRPTS